MSYDYGFKNADAAADAVLKGVAATRKGNVALVAFAFIKGELPSAERMKARADFSSLNTLKVLGAVWREDVRETECKALIDSASAVGFDGTLGNYAKIAREAIGGEGIQPSEMLTGKGETRAVRPEIAAKAKAGATAALAVRKAAAKAAARDAAPAGKPVDSKPAGVAEPSPAQKAAPRARMAALINELAVLMAECPVTEPSKREPLGKAAMAALQKFEAIIK